MRKKLTDSGLALALHHHARETIDAANDFRELADHGFELVQAGMQGGGIFKFQIGWRRHRAARRFPAARDSPPVSKYACTRDYFGSVFLVAAALEAGRETHLHFRVDATRELGIGMQIVDATSHLEKIERVAGKLLRRSTRSEMARSKCCVRRDGRAES